ncbi:YlbD family protein [Halalkalibacter krulwichiae]|uniref:Uncharacterized protein n=1 Tax=Halalkalibacter krulwichiae TaxID=199441 RepID=A0A1X9MCI9_9BACI|nr:YlbD family protein [Halalkalibacter krulwichiae]ARK31128.1 hypothetical protein BkAM31D_15435 [Halalkalibacter krulwichiae]
MSSNQGLHPSIQQFKQFMKEHPLLVKEVKENKRTLQELYEEWMIVGGEHEQWTSYKLNNDSPTSKQPEKEGEEDSADSIESSQSTGDALGQIMGIVKRMNVQDLQNHLAQFSSVLTNVQNVMQSFQKPSNPSNQSPQDHPFAFRRD